METIGFPGFQEISAGEKIPSLAMEGRLAMAKPSWKSTRPKAAANGWPLPATLKYTLPIRQASWPKACATWACYMAEVNFSRE